MKWKWENTKRGKNENVKTQNGRKSFQITSVVGLQRIHHVPLKPSNMLINACLQLLFPHSHPAVSGPGKCLSYLPWTSCHMYSHGILAMARRSVSQFQVCHQWHSTSYRFLHLRRTLNTFSASVVTSLLAWETVLGHH